MYGLCAAICLVLQAAAAPTAMDMRRAIIEASREIYAGPCPCPDNIDAAGRRCGRRSAWSRIGGAEPYCFPDDVPAARLHELFAIAMNERRNQDALLRRPRP